MRAIVLDAEGNILRTVSAAASQLHLQAGPGESVFALTDGDEGQTIDDAKVKVSEDGNLISTTGDAAPDIRIDLIAGPA